MPVEIKACTHGSFYIPMDGPWNSEEDNEAFAEAEKKYIELVESGKPYVVLIKSHHLASHGYWIEVEEKEMPSTDLIIKRHPK